MKLKGLTAPAEARAEFALLRPIMLPGGAAKARE